MNHFQHAFRANANVTSGAPSVGFLLILFSVSVLIGTFFILKGMNGIKNRRIRGKYGRVFVGKTAQIVGGIWVALGVFIVVVPTGFWLIIFVLAHFLGSHRPPSP